MGSRIPFQDVSSSTDQSECYSGEQNAQSDWKLVSKTGEQNARSHWKLASKTGEKENTGKSESENPVYTVENGYKKEKCGEKLMRQADMILYEDKDIIVCHKPAGIPVQSARLGQKDMVSILNNHLAEKEEKIQVNVVHRLDQPVEGVIVFAKTKRAAAQLGKQIQQGSMKKIYHAVCCVNGETGADRSEENGEVQKMKSSDQSGESEGWRRNTRYQLTDYLLKDGRTNSSSVVNRNVREAKKAELEFAVIGEYQAEGEKKNTAENSSGNEKINMAQTISENEPEKGLESRIAERAAERKYVLAEIELKTGRHHQIRVQMAHAGLPLYGDQKYNPYWQEYQLDQEKEERKTGLGLCAVSLTFEHPVKGKKMTFQVNPENAVFQLFK